MKAVLFDFNGTLFQDTEYHIEAWNTYIRETLELDFTRKDYDEIILGRDNNSIIRKLYNTEDIKTIWQISEEKERRYRELCKASDIRLTKGAKRLFDELKKQNIPFTIATGANKSNVDFYFDVFHLRQWFDYDKIVYDDGYLPGKPDPTVYLLAAQKLNVNPKDCIAVEDSPAGVMSAKNAGIKEIYVISDEKVFGDEVKDILCDLDELRMRIC